MLTTTNGIIIIIRIIKYEIQITRISNDDGLRIIKDVIQITKIRSNGEKTTEFKKT